MILRNIFSDLYMHIEGFTHNTMYFHVFDVYNNNVFII